ncbi:MAG: HAD-IB family hydrolase [Actinomycetota bacterium]|nr:HAD-IB family hydrolase [Actinomycetota bacterium]
MAAAAFFDLDRTLLDGGSGQAFGRALREVGLAPENEPPVLRQLLSLFDLIGENRATMIVVKQGIRLAKGWDVDLFERAGQLALEELIDQVQPFVPEILDQHRAAGRKLVLATASPSQLVRPLAEHLGLDDVVATTYQASGASLTGGIDGEFVWGRGKLEAVRSWASSNGVDLGSSWAYSDSWYDAPLLDAVGTAVAANPDPRLAVLARLRGWDVRHLDKPSGMAKLGPFEVQELVRPLLARDVLPLAEILVAGEGFLPASGPAIVAANHRSYFDIAVIAVAMAKANRPIRFLGKAEIFDTPVVGDIAAALGGIRVDRGSSGTAPLDAALSSLRAGEVVGLMPQGTIPRGEAFFEPELVGRPGVARLAAESGAPIVPLGLWGTEAVWPRSSKTPRLSVGSRPTVDAAFGPPVGGLTGTDHQADTAAVMRAIGDLLPAEAREQRPYTEAELAATYPSGMAPG